MLELKVSAETLSELRTKALSSLGLSEDNVSPTEGEANESPSITPAGAKQGDLSQLAGNKAPRTRRTAAQVEADRQAKNAQATSPAEVIQNNFEAGDAATEAEAVATQQVEPPKAAKPAITPDEAKAAFRDMMGVVDVTVGTAVLAKFNATAFSGVKSEDYPALVKECNAIKAKKALE